MNIIIYHRDLYQGFIQFITLIILSNIKENYSFSGLKDFSAFLSCHVEIINKNTEMLEQLFVCRRAGVNYNYKYVSNYPITDISHNYDYNYVIVTDVCNCVIRNVIEVHLRDTLSNKTTIIT